MLRYIVKVTQVDERIGLNATSFTTTTDPAVLENELRRGGSAEWGHDRAELVGVELIDDAARPGAAP